MTFELMLDEDLNFANYLCKDGGGRKGLGPLLEDDWKNIRNFSKFLQVFYEVTVEISVPYALLQTFISAYSKKFMIV